VLENPHSSSGVDGGTVVLMVEQGPAQLDAFEIDVLIVEADPRLRRHIAEALQSAGYRVGEAADSFDALQQIRSRRVGAMVLDTAVPELDGFDLLEKVGGISCPPVVMLRTPPSRPAARTRNVMAEVDNTMELSTLPPLVATALEADGWRGVVDQLPPADWRRFDRVTD
jgi:DNA-binding NtrC family response regulator